MHVITRRTFVEFAQHHADSKGPLEAWYRAARDARWANIRDVRAVFPHADAVTVDPSGRTMADLTLISTIEPDGTPMEGEIPELRAVR